jgi:hypothetical protein
MLDSALLKEFKYLGSSRQRELANRSVAALGSAVRAVSTADFVCAILQHRDNGADDIR